MNYKVETCKACGRFVIDTERHIAAHSLDSYNKLKACPIDDNGYLTAVIPMDGSTMAHYTWACGHTVTLDTMSVGSV